MGRNREPIDEKLDIYIDHGVLAKNALKVNEALQLLLKSSRQTTETLEATAILAEVYAELANPRKAHEDMRRSRKSPITASNETKSHEEKTTE